MKVKTKRGELPVHFGMNALALYGDLTNQAMNDVVTGLSDIGKLKFSQFIALLYAGFVIGAKKEGVECLVESPEDVGDMIDADGDLIDKAMSAYVEQAAPSDEEQPGDKKK